jgi:hypothetical protein
MVNNPLPAPRKSANAAAAPDAGNFGATLTAGAKRAMIESAPQMCGQL